MRAEEFYKIKRSQEHLGFEEESMWFGTKGINWQKLCEENNFSPENRSFEELVNFVVEKYPRDPRKQKTKPGIDLFDFVVEELNTREIEIDAEDPKELGFFDCRGFFQLDNLRGIDGFFLYTPERESLKKRNWIACSIDVTANPSKDEYKVNIIPKFPDYREEKQKYEEKMRNVARMIADKIKARADKIRRYGLKQIR